MASHVKTINNANQKYIISAKELNISLQCKACNSVLTKARMYLSFSSRSLR